VVNWHLLEPCQLKCKYCYAEWNKEKLPLIYKNTAQSVELIKQISHLRSDYQTVRLSFAGGEPMLDKNLGKKITAAKKYGLKISLITNGDLLSEDFLYENCTKIDLLGISIDSVNPLTNLQIGRATLLGRVPDYPKIAGLIKLAKKINPMLEIKINTVVNAFNFDEDMTDFMLSVQPNKWKILNVLPATNKAKTQEISAQKFEFFVNRHRHLPNVAIEDNAAMYNSYLMIDPYGRFFCNAPNQTYHYSPPILDIGIDTALKSIDFDYQKFQNRY
jgi:radical S-adenosyl methionine domain-containing protein 2